MRLDRFIANNSALSRSDVKRALKAGEVEVNNTPTRDAGQHIDAEDTVLLSGAIVRPVMPRYLMLNKPAGYESSTRSSEAPSVLDLIASDLRDQGPPLQLVGRLDKDTTGLLLLTDDGDWNHRICSPRRACMKSYLIELAAPAEAHYAEALKQGLMLKGDAQPTEPAQYEIITAQRVMLSIREGRYHQVKRMFAALGNRVTHLHRCAIGELVLDAELNPGDYRPLTELEVALFQ